MARKQNRRQVSVTLDQELYDWATKHAGPGTGFASLSVMLDEGLRIIKQRHEAMIEVRRLMGEGQSLADALREYPEVQRMLLDALPQE